MYAGGTCVTMASENLNDLITDLKNEQEDISNWMRINKLELNASKSEFMVVGHRRKLNRVGEKIKYLGINMHKSLNWEEQYKTVKNKLKRGISSLRKLKDLLPQRKLNQVYKALFESHLRYDQGRWKESRARGADRSKRAPTTLGQQIYPRNGGHPRHFLGISWAMPLTVI